MGKSSERNSRECLTAICSPLNAKEILKFEGSPQSHEQLETRSFMHVDAPTLAMMRTCPWNAEELASTFGMDGRTILCAVHTIPAFP